MTVMPLDFTGYVPGIPNMGPHYKPPTTIQLIEALQLEIKTLKQIVEGLAPESELAELEHTVDVLDDAIAGLAGRMDTAEDAIDTLSNTTIPAIQQDLTLKEDKSNKIGDITADSPDWPFNDNEYASVPAIRSFVQDIDESIRDDMADIETLAASKADGAGYDSHEELNPAKMAQGILYGELLSTSTSTNLLADVPTLISELRHGLAVLIKNNVVTSAAGCTLNVNNTGAKPIYSSMAQTTAVTTTFNINYTMLFIYDEIRVSGGCWVMYYGYDSNTNTIGYQIRSNSYSLPMDSTVYRYRLLFTSADGTHFVPANNSSSTNATATRTVCQTPINPHGAIVYYGTTASVSPQSRPNATQLWSQYAITLGYSFNRTGSALNLATWTPVYLKCSPQTDGSAIMDATTPYVQTLPTTADGYIYIFLGVAYSATQIEVLQNHPVYYHDGTAIRIWTGPVTP